MTPEKQYLFADDSLAKKSMIPSWNGSFQGIIIVSK
jgi:hypothetical protein